MKKLMLLISIFGLFVLVSCNDDNYYTDDSSNAHQTGEINSGDTESINDSVNDDTKDETNNNINNQDTQSDSKEDNNASSSSNEENKSNDQKDDSVYDDGIEWGPLH